MHDVENANRLQQKRSLVAHVVSFDEFLSKYQKRVYKKGETILLQNEIPRLVYLIESGEVKTYTIDSSGSERLVSFHSKKESLPIGFVFWMVEKSQYFYEAYTKCEIRLIPREDLICYLDSNTRSLRNLYMSATKRLLFVMNRICMLEQPSALRKVASRLLMIPEELDMIKHRGISKLRLSITQQEIADSIGLTRETTSIELKKLQKMRLIDYSRSNYVIYLERLKKYLTTEII